MKIVLNYVLVCLFKVVAINCFILVFLYDNNIKELSFIGGGMFFASYFFEDKLVKNTKYIVISLLILVIAILLNIFFLYVNVECSYSLDKYYFIILSISTLQILNIVYYVKTSKK